MMQNNPFAKYVPQPAQQPQPSQFPGVIQGKPKPVDPNEVIKTEQDITKGNLDIQSKQLALEEQKAKLAERELGAKLGKESGFYLRAAVAGPAFEKLVIGPEGQFRATVGGVVPDGWLNALTSEDRQVAEAYMRDFAMASLRYESGAAIPPEEINSQIRTFFPVAGDKEATIKAKAQLRRNLIQSLRMGAGPDAAKEVDAYLASLGEQGGQQAAQSSAPQGPAADQTRYATEKDRRNAAGLRQLYVGGASLDQMVDYLKGIGQAPGFAELRSLKENIDYREGRGQFQGAKPTQQDLERQIQGFKTGRRGAIGSGLANFATTGVGAAVTGALDFHGGLDELTAAATGGDLATINANKEAVRAANPGAYFGGQIAGNLAGGAAVARFVPGVAGALTANTGRVAATSAGVGATQGALENNENRMIGGAIGAGLGGALGFGGAKVGNALAQRAATRADGAVPANALAQAGQAEGVTVNRAMVDPSLENRFAAAEARQGSGPRINAEMDRIQGQVEGRVRELGGGVPAPQREAMGATAQTAARRNVDATRARASRIYDKADQAAGGRSVAPNRAIAEIDQNIAELEASGANANSGQIKYLQDLKADMQSGMTVRGLRDLRTNMRGQINERNLNQSDAERRVGRVLDAASEDISTALGDSPAGKLYNQADALWREQADFSKQIRDALVGPANNPKSGTQGAAKLESLIRDDYPRAKRLWDAMDDAEKADLRAYTAQSLGTNAKGEFSPAIFLNNLPGGKSKTLSERSAKLIFGKDGAESLENLKLLATEINRLNSVGNRGSARANNYRNWLFEAVGLLGGGGGALVAGTGSVGTLAGAAGGAAVAAGGRALRDAIDVRALMSPEITRWLRQAPKTVNPKAIDSHFARLTAIAQGNTAAAEPAQFLAEMITRAANDNAGMSAVAEQDVTAQQPQEPSGPIDGPK